MGGTLKDLVTGGLTTVARGGAGWTSLAVHAAKAPHSVDWTAIVTRTGIWAGIVGAIAAVIAVVPMFRNVVRWAWRALLMRIGLPYRRYAKKFIREFGSYENPYLGEYEQIDLRTTYVPLSFQAEDAQSYAIATHVLTALPVGRGQPVDPEQPGDRRLITGDPGSGKSTLLKAYGVGILEGRQVMTRGPRVVPYFVRLRELAKFVTSQHGLAEFITGEILRRQGFFDAERGKAFFEHTVARRQAVILLDGLDEVPDDKQRVVLGAIRSFMRDESEECPTVRTTILLTCRTQNFRMLRDNWVPAFARPEHVYALAPLRDSEIVEYVQKFWHKFKTADGPVQFMRSVRGSGKTGADRTIDLLRAPLVLAMAVGLYAHRPARIPNTIAKLYQAMIEEMLERHGFKYEAPEDSLLSYRMNDKYRFLRRFALHAVEKSGVFGDFTKPELVAYSAELAPSLEAVDSPAGLVDEIIKHSSLLTTQEHSDLYFFAHQSVQEFLAAEELQHQRDGDAFLLDRATDMNWRQAIQFYTAGREAGQVDEFITELAKRDSELAAYCLRAASPSDGAARVVLDVLKPITNARLNALAAASWSPRIPIQRMAINELTRFIADSPDAFSAAGTSIDGMLPLLESLAGTNAGEIAALVPHVIGDLPDDPRLVGPLWQCLSAAGIERHRAQANEIVRRLLAMVMEPDGFAELQRQDPHDREFLTALRPHAYPFKSALALDHNLVTLLAWADYLGVLPTEPNRFFKAKAARRLAQVETDRQKTIVFSPCWPGRIAGSILIVAAFCASVAVLIVHPGMLKHPFGWWTLALIFGVAAFPVGMFVFYGLVLEKTVNLPPLLRLSEGEDESGHILSYVMEITHEDSLMIVTLFVVPFFFAIAPIPLARDDLPVYLVIAISSHLLLWLTILKAFNLDTRYYLHRPNEYVDMYEDERSRLWLARPLPLGACVSPINKMLSMRLLAENAMKPLKMRF
jgi:NACHT domain